MENVSDDDDDDEPDSKRDTSQQVQQQFGDVHEKLKHAKCQFVPQTIDNIERIEEPRFLADQFDQLKDKLKNENVDGYNEKTC